MNAFRLLDVGFGHGDMLRRIACWARSRGLAAELIERPDVRKGIAIAFGPGLAAEGFHFERAA